ncbi:MAG: hypothetical protein ACO3J6_11390 [Opitutales bacterium]
MASIQAALLFLIVANPATYRLVQMIFGALFKVANATTGCPSAAGLLLHAVVFGLLSYGLMMLKRPAVVVVAEEAEKAGEMVMDAGEMVAEDVVKAEKAIAAEVMGREGMYYK